MIKPAQLPTSILDLAKPQWKGKVAIAPTDSDFVPLVGGVIASYGQQAALNWLRGLKANSASVADDEAVVASSTRDRTPWASSTSTTGTASGWS